MPLDLRAVTGSLIKTHFETTLQNGGVTASVAEAGPGRLTLEIRVPRRTRSTGWIDLKPSLLRGAMFNPKTGLRYRTIPLDATSNPRWLQEWMAEHPDELPIREVPPEPVIRYWNRLLAQAENEAQRVAILQDIVGKYAGPTRSYQWKAGLESGRRGNVRFRTVTDSPEQEAAWWLPPRIYVEPDEQAVRMLEWLGLL